MKFRHFIPVAMAVALAACQPTPPPDDGESADTLQPGDGSQPQGYDLADIQASGQLIVASMSGPDTYYEYQGRPMGLQYAYVAAFARQAGVAVRIKVARDTAALFSMLRGGQVDVVALPLPESAIAHQQMKAAGLRDTASRQSWAVRCDAPLLAAALDAWFASTEAAAVGEREVAEESSIRRVKRRVRAPYVSREKGIISVYDEYFRRAARVVGWDWHLLAAQCYQESGFDPNAVSGAGACGLMQIMPATAQQLQLPESRMFEPEANIMAAGRYLKMLCETFRDIQPEAERIRFVLAAYNGGAGHVRDAIALARKFSRCEAPRWEDIAPYIEGLRYPHYYQDPIVNHGYMMGSETVNYVERVVARWEEYGRQNPEATPRPSRSNNRYKQRREDEYTQIYSPAELRRMNKP